MYFRDNKIMLKDDSNNTNNLIKFFFEKEGYNVYSYTNSIEALDSFSKDKVHLVILDSKIRKLKEPSIYKKFKEIDSKVSICLTNADMECLQKIKREIADMNNNTILKFLFIDEKTKVELHLLKNKDTIVIKS